MLKINIEVAKNGYFLNFYGGKDDKVKLFVAKDGHEVGQLIEQEVKNERKANICK